MKKLLIAGMINLLLLNIVLAEDKWEYEIYLAGGKSLNDIEYELNSYGLDGWELVAVTGEGGYRVQNGAFILKRKIED